MKRPRPHWGTVLSPPQTVLKGALAVAWAWFGVSCPPLFSFPNFSSLCFKSWGQAPVLQIMIATESGFYNLSKELMYTGNSTPLKLHAFLTHQCLVFWYVGSESYSKPRKSGVGMTTFPSPQASFITLVGQCCYSNLQPVLWSSDGYRAHDNGEKIRLQGQPPLSNILHDEHLTSQHRVVFPSVEGGEYTMPQYNTGLQILMANVVKS